MEVDYNVAKEDHVNDRINQRKMVCNFTID